MAKRILDAQLDLMLAALEGSAVHVCSAEPVNKTEAESTYQLASQAITGANYTKANGDTSGRKTTLAPPTGTSIDNSGTGTHIAVTTATDLKVVTTCASQALTSGGTVDIGAFAHEQGDVA